jgi:hypothetical protein
MKHHIVLAWMVGLVATFAATTVEAQRWGRPTAPRSGACFYRDANFQGDFFCVNAGDEIEALPGNMNDEISSIRTFGGDVEVMVFQSRRFDGRSERFDGNVRNLKDEGWNDRLSSLQVRSTARGNGRGNGRGRGRGDGFGNQADNPDRIVRRAYQDILDREPDTAGLRLYRSRIIDDGWSEEQVRDALRRSPEYRERTTMTRARAEEIVRRAYLSVLNREPDPAGRGYVDRVLRDNWTEEDVVRELRRSPEFRNRGR